MKESINEKLKIEETEISNLELVGEEAPPGKTFITPLSKKVEEISFKEYEIKGINDTIYDLKIFRNQNSISFHVKGKSFFNKIFKKELSLDEFYNLNRFFRQYISLEDLFNILLKNLEQSEILISEEYTSQLKLILIIEIRGRKEEIPFILEQNQSESENLIFNLSEHIKEIESQKKSNENVLKEFNEIKEKINELNKSNKIYLNIIKIILFFFLILIIIRNNNKPIKKEIANIKEDLVKLEAYNKEFVKKDELASINNQIEKKFIKSTIIGYGELDFIEDELQKIYNKKILKYELLFRASRDGFGINDFGIKCNDKTDTLTIVKTNDNKRFGGFTKLAHNNQNRLTNSIEFTFSLDKSQIYYYKEDNNNNNYYYSNGYNNNVLFFKGKNGFTISENSNKNKYSQDFFLILIPIMVMNKIEEIIYMKIN